MRSVLFLLLLVAMSPAASPKPASAKKATDDWRESLTTKTGKTPALRPLKAEYDFGWSGVKAAEATATFSHPKKRFELALDSHTVGLARTMWKMDSTAVSTVNDGTLRPMKLVQTEKYSDKTLTTTVDYSPSGVARLKVANPADKKPPKVKRFKFDQVHDLHSALLFIRSHRLKTGDVIRLCVYPGSSPYFAEVTVSGREEIEVAGKKWSAIKCDLKLQEVDKDFHLVAHDKFKKATVWLSDDADRLLLKLETDVFVGKVWAELKKVEFEDVKAGPKKAPGKKA